MRARPRRKVTQPVPTDHPAVEGQNQPAVDKVLSRMEFNAILEPLAADHGIRRMLAKTHRRCARLIALDDFRQMVLVRALAMHDTFLWQGLPKFKAWLAVIALHLVADIARRPGLAATIPVVDNRYDAAASATDAAIHQEQLARLAMALAALDEADRELLRLYYAEDMTFKEIAEQRSAKKNTIIQQHRRLLDRLRNEEES
jgi:RNA polymerase sigma factor (sigma-70 family)